MSPFICSANLFRIVAGVWVFSVFNVYSANAESQQIETDTKVRYQSPQEIEFDKVLIQGSLRRPELNVVIGQEQKGGNGLLRLRKDFQDRIQIESGARFETAATSVDAGVKP